MKITIDVLDEGFLAVAEHAGQVERAAYASPYEALEAVARTLGIPNQPQAPVAAPRASVAPSPETAEDVIRDINEVTAQAALTPPPATRRIGLSQPKKSLPPAGQRGRA